MCVSINYFVIIPVFSHVFFFFVSLHHVSYFLSLSLIAPFYDSISLLYTSSITFWNIMLFVILKLHVHSLRKNKVFIITYEIKYENG